ncbi:MAG TPA: nitrilase-related carbon-nitrogen hydrolase [Candidatus Binatia bacterium]|jgi:predicted amidohydrolase|nr:nitrilase-related carbon-nitrogen hydrolase [Candidatus Binatia bacterium]
MESKYSAIIIQTRVKECFNRQDVIDNFARACRVTHTSVRHPYFGRNIPNKLVAFDTHAHNHGYSRREIIEKIAIEIPGKEMGVVSDLARRDGVFVVTSALEFDANFRETFFTCYFIVDPKGDVIYKYRKIHTHLGTEKTLSPYDVMDKYYELYGRGKSILETFFPIAETPLGKIGTLIAHDRVCPEAARAMALNGAEILVLGPQPEPSVANGRWEIMNRARAFENMFYVMAANYGEFISEDRVAQRWAGHSMIVDFNGQIVGSSPYPGEAACAAVIDIDALRQRRADAHDSPLAELRTDVYREIYAQDIYEKNRYANSVPEDSANERLSFFPEVYQKLVDRHAYMKPKGS